MISSYINKFNLCLKIENSININAPLRIVWSVTEDIERWPEWTPTVTAVRRLDNGPFGLGSIARLKQPGQSESDWTVIKYVKEESFTWETKRSGLRMSATHKIKRKKSRTLNTLRVEASGILAVVFWPVLRVAIRRTLLKENHGLKTRCESLPFQKP